MIEEAIILVGGRGIRLKSVINDIPKPMARINGKPFLSYILNYLSNNLIKNVILSVGYKSNVIEDYFGNSYKDISIEYSKEDLPLGTGGGLMKATKLIKGDYFFALNGDTIFDVDLQKLGGLSVSKNSTLVVALKKVENNSRYSTVTINNEGQILSFTEKKNATDGYINGGIYCLRKEIFLNIYREEFSFEKEVLEQTTIKNNFYGLVFSDYFIDIGIPEDYYKAQYEFEKLGY